MTITALLLTSRLLLAAVFGMAGITKLADLAGSRKALSNFGVLASLAGPLGLALPLAELLVALALLAQRGTVYGALGALLLLMVFIAAMGRSLARGRTPDCHCFGQLHSEPIGWKTLARNGAMAAVAAFIIMAGWTDPGPSVVAWLIPLTTFQRAMALGGALGLALLGTQSALLVKLVRQNDRLLRRVTATSNVAATDDVETSHAQVAIAGAAPVASLAIGSPAPTFALPTLEGDTVTLDMLGRAGKPIVLLFSDPSCASCSALLPLIEQWHREHAGALTLAIVSRGTPEANRAKTSSLRLPNVLLQNDREVTTAYSVQGTPSAVVIRTDGTIGSAPAQGKADITQLVVQAVESAAIVVTPPASLQVAPMTASGSPSPDFTRPDLKGQPVTLSRFANQPTAVLFWNPGCGFCRRMLDDLKTWEASPLAGQPQLLVVSTGAADDNVALGLRSTIVLDQGFSIGRQYGAHGTPSAVLVDAEGHIITGPVVGGPEVLALIGFDPPSALLADARPSKQDSVDDELLSDGSMVLYNGNRRQMLTLNGTAALIWECCDGDHSIGDIIAEVAGVFPSASHVENVEHDVRQMLGRLLEAGMISFAPAPPPAPSTYAAASTTSV